MGIKLPVVDIPIDDTKFKRFEALFQQYQDRLSKTPGIWQKVNKEFTATTAAVLAQNQAMRESLSSEREQVRHLTVAQRLWTGISGNARGVAGSMLSATATLLKWTGAFAGAGSIFGPLALSHMASGVADERRTSKEFGVSIGGLRAFKTDMSRFVNPTAFLGGITEMRTNPELQGALAALGISPNGSTMNVAMQVMDALRQQALMTPVNLLGTVLKKFPVQGVSTADLMTFRGTGNAEWAKQRAALLRDAKSMNTPDSTAQAWTNFDSQMKRAEQQIKATFVTGLLPLAKPIEDLSGSFVKVLQSLMKKDGVIETGINTFSKWLDDWNGHISKPKFIRDIEQFTSDVGALAGTFHQFTQAVGLAHQGKYKSALGAVGFGTGDELPLGFRFMHPSGLAPWLGLNKSTGRDYLSAVDKYFGFSKGLMEGVWQAESSSRFNPPNSRKGAVGPFQLMPKTASALGVDPQGFESAGYGAGQLLWQYREAFGGTSAKDSMAKALAAYNWGYGNVSADIARYGAAWRSHLPRETRAYLSKADITINNNTGGQVHVIANGLAQ